jgi:flagellum-specific peptidoglycan hydrolase FlgJ
MSVTDFVNKYYQEAAAVSSMNLPPSFILAHAYLESGRGASELTRTANNFFGIKALPNQDSVTYTTTEILNGKAVRIPQKFRKYDTAKSSFKAYVNLLSSNRYKKVLQARTHLTRAQELKNAGYFTAGLDYINTLNQVARQFDEAIKKRPNSTIIAPLIGLIILTGVLVIVNK